MRVVNLTPHEVNVVNADGNVVVSVPSEGVARANQTDEKVGLVVIDGKVVDVVKTSYGETVGLPEASEGTVYIVSLLTIAAARAQGRTTEDLLTTSGPVRDDQGRIIDCSRFARA